MKKTTTLLAALAFGAATAVAGVAPAPSGKGVSMPPPPMDPCAGPISYTNVELLYAYTDFDGPGDDSSDGGIVRIEYSPLANFYVTVSAQYTDYDSGHIWNLQGGIGGYVPLTENIHIAADGGVVYADWEYDYLLPIKGSNQFGTYSDNDTGWYARPHIRAKFGCLTVHAGAQYTDIEDNEDWTYFASLYYQFAQNWDVTAGISDSDDDTQVITAGLRWRY